MSGYWMNVYRDAETGEWEQTLNKWTRQDDGSFKTFMVEGVELEYVLISLEHLSSGVDNEYHRTSAASEGWWSTTGQEWEYIAADHEYQQDTLRYDREWEESL
jgi:hypothetical protein